MNVDQFALWVNQMADINKLKISFAVTDSKYIVGYISDDFPDEALHKQMQAIGTAIVKKFEKESEQNKPSLN